MIKRLSLSPTNTYATHQPVSRHICAKIGKEMHNKTQINGSMWYPLRPLTKILNIYDRSDIFEGSHDLIWDIVEGASCRALDPALSESDPWRSFESVCLTWDDLVGLFLRSKSVKAISVKLIASIAMKMKGTNQYKGKPSDATTIWNVKEIAVHINRTYSWWDNLLTTISSSLVTLSSALLALAFLDARILDPSQFLSTDATFDDLLARTLILPSQSGSLSISRVEQGNILEHRKQLGWIDHHRHSRMVPLGKERLEQRWQSNKRKD